MHAAGDEAWSARRVAAAGFAGTLAVRVAMTGARRAGVTRLEFPRLLATALGEERRSTRAAGWALFVANGALLPFAYRAALRLGRVRGSVRIGAALGLLHGLVAAGGAALLAPLHPRPLEARLTSATHRWPAPRALATLAGVHVLYGAVLGAFARGRA
jgi:hypothetical protein